jgi:hypothetical protein
MPEELPVVAAPNKMDDETFIKHINARHEKALGYTGGPLSYVGSWPDQIATYRVYHKKIHEGIVRDLDNNHTHSQGDQPWQDPQEAE